MELTAIRDKTLEIFDAKNPEELGTKILEACKKNQREKIIAFKNFLGDLSEDYLQKIYQYYIADRENLGQDYTPASLAKLVQKLSNESSHIIDLCAGSGALTIQQWAQNNDIKATLYECGEKVIPYLVLNMIIRNIPSKIIQGDVLTRENKALYEIKKGEEIGELYEHTNI